MKSIYKIIILLIITFMLSGCFSSNHIHRGDEWLTNEPTCTSHGYKYQKCNKCDYVIKGELLPALGHNYGEWEVVLEPQLFETGLEQSVCVNCGDKYEREIPAIHVHEIDEVFVIEKEATCKTYGMKSYHCIKDNCDYRTNITVIQPLPHNLKKINETESTCVTHGKIGHSYCDSCGGYFVNNREVDVRTLLKELKGHNTRIIKLSETEYGIQCLACDQIVKTIENKYTENLNYKKNEDNNSYTVLGLKDSTEEEIVIIPEVYQGLPVTKIGSNAFSGESIKYLIMPDTIKVIEHDAFFNCLSLKNVKLSNSLEIIGEQAFADCTNLMNINIAKSLKQIDANAFMLCMDMNNIFLDGDINDWMNVKLVNNYSHPLGYSSGGVYSFDNENNEYIEITNIELPKDLERLDTYNIAFFNNIQSIYIPKTINHIEKDPFSRYGNLQEVYYDGTMADWCKINFNTMRDNPFYWNKKAEMYTLIDGNYQKMSVLDIPEGVTEVNKYAFAGFRFIERINIPKSLITINESGFYILSDCQDFYYAGTPEDWSNITFENGSANPIGYFKNQYFLNENNEYQKITELDLRNLSEIKSNTFIYMPDVTKLYISNKLENCRNMAIQELHNLKEVYFEGTIGEWFDINFELSSNPLAVAGADLYVLNEEGNYYKVEILEIPKHITKINAEQFYKCTSIKFIYIHKDVTEIGYRAFVGCKNVLIYCQMNEIPVTWKPNWCDSSATINMGYK